MTIQTEVAESLAQKVREGTPLRQAIEEAKLPERQTLHWLKKNFRQLFRDAKSSQVKDLGSESNV